MKNKTKQNKTKQNKKRWNKKKQAKKDTWVVLFYQRWGGREKLEMYQLLRLTKIE